MYLCSVVCRGSGTIIVYATLGEGLYDVSTRIFAKDAGHIGGLVWTESTDDESILVLQKHVFHHLTRSNSYLYGVLV